MSIKLHHGVRFRSTDLNDAATVVAELRRTFSRAARDITLDWLAERAARHIDAAALRDADNQLQPKSHSPPLTAAWAERQRRVRTVEKEGLRDPPVDVNATLCILPTQDHYLLALLYAEWSGAMDLLLTHDSIEAWPYWDNTDRPHSVTPEEWERRRTIWLSAFGREGENRTPAEVGLTATLSASNSILPPEITEVVERVPDVMVRAERWALRRVADRKAKELAEKTQAIDNPDRMIHCVLRASRWAQKSPDGIRAVRVERTVILPHLLARITEQELSSPVPIAHDLK